MCKLKLSANVLHLVDILQINNTEGISRVRKDLMSRGGGARGAARHNAGKIVTNAKLLNIKEVCFKNRQAWVFPLCKEMSSVI